jgi:VWFA-related protein
MLSLIPRKAFLCWLVALAAFAVTLPLQAQDTNPPAPANAQQQGPAEAGGPEGDSGPIALPRTGEKPIPPPPPKPSKIENMPEFSITKDVPVVNLDVSVTTKDGQFIPGLSKDNFKVFEDGVPQKITNFNRSQAPITAVLLVEFASTNYAFVGDALRAAYTFEQTLTKDDWIALISYDMKPHILTDFTQDKNAVLQGLNSMRIPGFSETNLFDALYDTLDRLDGVEGRKYIVLIASGCDSFSKMNLNQIMNKIRATHNVTIFPMSTGQHIRLIAESMHATGYLPCSGNLMTPNSIAQMDFLQADNQMNTFARMTGGHAYFPRFEGEFAEDFRDIGQSIRNQYTLAYHPTNPKLDGTYRKLKVELQAPNGGALTIKDQKGKNIKPLVIAREGYTAKHQVE